jgi:hypothetical protein
LTEDDDREILYDLIRKAESQSRPANPAEIALICDLAPPRNEFGEVTSQHIDFTYGGVKGICKSKQM